MRTFEKCVLVCVRVDVYARALRAINFCEHTFAHSNVFSFSLLLSLTLSLLSRERRRSDDDRREEQRGDFARRRRW